MAPRWLWCPMARRRRVARRITFDAVVVLWPESAHHRAPTTTSLMG